MNKATTMPMTQMVRSAYGTYHKVMMNGQVLGYVKSWDKGRFGIEQTLSWPPSNSWRGDFKSKKSAVEAVVTEARLSLKKLMTALSMDAEHVFHVGDLVEAYVGKDEHTGNLNQSMLGYIVELSFCEETALVCLVDGNSYEYELPGLTWIRECTRDEQEFFDWLETGERADGWEPKDMLTMPEFLATGKDIQDRLKQWIQTQSNA